MPFRRSPRTRIDQSPLAATSSRILLGLGYTHDLRTITDVIKLLRGNEISGAIFVGVVLEGSQGAKALKQFEDASAEIAATSQVGQRRPRRGQR